MSRYILADAEADGLDPTKVHCISAKEYPSGETIRWTEDELEYFISWVESTPVTKWFFHNGLNYDVDVINRLVKPNLIKHEDVVDTQVVSRLVDYKRYNTHSLKEIGISLGVHKGDYTGGWEEYTEEMGEYCDQDVEVLHAIVDDQWKYITDPQWSEAMRLEHEMAIICKEMQDNGFLFNKPEAELMLAEVKEEMEAVETSFREAFGTKRVELKRCKYRLTKDGSLYGNVRKDFEEYNDIEIDGDEYVVYEQKEFNPGSPKERIDALWDAGWKPTDKTKGHINKIKEARKGTYR